jgi:hypothetical protein
MENENNLITDSNTVNSFLSQKLEKVATRQTGWIALYREKGADVFWETFYPHGEMQGGGPVALRKVSRDFIQKNYGLLK